MNLLTTNRSGRSSGSGRQPEIANTVRVSLRAAVQSLLAALLGVGGAVLILQVDEAANLSLPVSSGNARAVVAGLVTAFVTLAIFSVWMRSVVASLASGQISSRIVAGYLDDDLQWELITGMSAAFTFTLTVLLHLPAEEAAGVPALSMILAVCLVILGLVTVMGALRGAVHGLAPSRILTALAARARQAIDDDPVPDDDAQDDPWHGDPAPEAAATIEAEHTGWVRAIDRAAILDRMPARSRLGLHVDVGSFVAAGDRLASCDAGLSTRAMDAIRDAIETADVRDAEADLGFVLQHLRDLAQHAFGSTGDSSLSEEALLHLRAILTQIIDTGLPSGHAVGAEDRQVIALERATVPDHLWNTLEPLVYASQHASPIARRSVARTIQHLRRRAAPADAATRAALDELLMLTEDTHQPHTSASARGSRRQR
jgi:uncharacterized membrane protein